MKTLATPGHQAKSGAISLTEVRAFIADYPELPAEVLRLLVTMSNPDYSFDRIAEHLVDLSSLKQRVLALANSPFFSPVEPIIELPHAEVMIGKSQLRALIVGAALRPIFGPYCGYGHEANGFWRHSIAVATAAAVLAEDHGASDSERGYVYLAGLFHDCGKLVLANLMEEKRIRVDIRQTPEDPPGLAALERETLGLDHCEVGAMLGAHWGLGERVQAVIADHHQPRNATDRAAAMLHFADHLVNSVEVGLQDGMPTESPLEVETLEFFSDDPEFLPKCESVVYREVARVLASLEVLE